ncbi:hypothetical protein [Streptomyces sp. NPDC003374]
MTERAAVTVPVVVPVTVVVVVAVPVVVVVAVVVVRWTPSGCPPVTAPGGAGPGSRTGW